MKAVYNTSTIALQFIKGNETGACGYNWATLSVKGVNKHWDLVLQVGGWT
jgi:hypothetical protein